MTANDPFSGSRLKLQRAWFHLRDLEQKAYDYSRLLKIRFGEFNETSKTRPVIFSPEPPQEFSCIIGDAVHNLRTTLDHLICDLARIRCGVKNKHKFPFAASEIDLEKPIKDNGFHEIGEDLIEIIRSLKPYNEGNAALRGLHDLDIKDKHQVIIPAFFKSFAIIKSENYQASGYIDYMKRANPGIKTTFNIPVDEGCTMVCTIDGGTMYSTIIISPNPPPVDLYNGKDFYFGDGGDPNLFVRQTRDPIQFIFQEGSGLPFAGKPVLKTLHDLAELVDGIVNLFATKFGARNAPSASA